VDLEAMLREALAGLAAYPEGGLARLGDERRADVVSWRWPAGRSSPHRPDPWANEEAGVEGEWLDGTPGWGRVVGLDDEDRPVLTEWR
jgi:hypothetical protein